MTEPSRTVERTAARPVEQKERRRVSLRKGAQEASPRRATRRWAALAALLGVLVLILLLSILVGAKPIPLAEAWQVLLHRDGSDDAIVVWEGRVPRTLLGLGTGAALGLAGALMQGLTRNPLADPGLLGVNAGAAAAVVIAAALLHIEGIGETIWFAFLGAALATATVYLLGSRGRGRATPVRLVLAGMAISAVLASLTAGITLINAESADRMRFWMVGSLAAAETAELWMAIPFLLTGGLFALALAGPLNALALGDETGRALGARLGETRVVTLVVVTLLCGTATATVGPITFVGLMVPHAVRLVTGPDHRWILPFSALLAPVVLLGADVVGRVIARPGELEAGVVTAFIGAPVFILLVRRQKTAGL